MTQIILDNWHLGGLSDSKYSGIANSTYKMVGMDIHSEPGLLKVQQTAKDAGDYASNIPSNKIVSIVQSTTTGDTYYFGGEDGQCSVWVMDGDSGTISLLGAITNATTWYHVTDAEEFKGDIYFATQYAIGKFTPTATPATGWAARNEAFKSIVDDRFHPMVVLENDLYVGSDYIVGKIVPDEAAKTLDASAVVDLGGAPNEVRITSTAHGMSVGDLAVINGTTNYDGRWTVTNVNDVDTFDIESTYYAETFSTTDNLGVPVTPGLDLQTDYRIESFGILRSNLIVGARRTKDSGSADDFTGFSRVFNWDLISPSWSGELEVAEFGISAFMDFGGVLLFNAGEKGMLYSYDGVNIQKFKRIPGDWSGTNRAVIMKNAVSAWNSIPIFGLSNIDGNPTEQGIYSLGGYDAKYPKVFNLEFLPLTGSGSGTFIGAVEMISWDHTASLAKTDLIFCHDKGGDEVINMVDTANKYNGAYLETQVIDVAREKQKVMKVRICYRTRNSQTITLSKKVNGAGAYTAVTLVNHDNMKYYESSINIANANTVQFKIATTASSNSAPEIEKIIIDF